MNNNSARKHEPQMSTTNHQTDTSLETCNGLNDAPILPPQAGATTTAQNDNDNARTYLSEKKNERPNVGQKFYTVNSSRNDSSPTSRPLSTGLLLPIALLITTITASLLQTWTAPLRPATAVQWLVTKVEKDGYFDAEVSDDLDATESRRDESYSPWDVWLKRKNEDIKSSLRCTTPGITAPLNVLVQWTVTQSGKSVFFDAEERYEYTAAESLSEEVRRPWDVWIACGCRQEQGRKGDLRKE